MRDCGFQFSLAIFIIVCLYQKNLRRVSISARLMNGQIRKEKSTCESNVPQVRK
jgi:hypothetical protein